MPLESVADLLVQRVIPATTAVRVGMIMMVVYTIWIVSIFLAMSKHTGSAWVDRLSETISMTAAAM